MVLEDKISFKVLHGRENNHHLAAKKTIFNRPLGCEVFAAYGNDQSDFWVVERFGDENLPAEYSVGFLPCDFMFVFAVGN